MGPNFVQIWQFWCRWKADDEIYPNLAKLNWEISKICQNRKFGFRVKDPKFGFLLGLRISNFRFLPKFKIWPKIKIPPRWFIITLRFHQNSKVKIFQNLSQYGRTIVTKTFQNFEVDIKITKIHQNWLKSPKFWRKILKTFHYSDEVFRLCERSSPNFRSIGDRPHESY